MAKGKYDTHVAPFLDKIALWAEKGASQAEIAKKLNLAASTFKLYLSKGDKGEEPYKDLSDCFRVACEVPDDNVEAAMYRRACGITWDEKTYETKLLDDGSVEEVMVKRVTKFIPPDPTSAMFWLTNRRPEQWKYKRSENDAEQNEGGVVVMPEIAAEDGGAR